MKPGLGLDGWEGWVGWWIWVGLCEFWFGFGWVREEREERGEISRTYTPNKLSN